jgi:tRNA nucleotidyltransferase (CCA-adding enzyme)
MEDVLRNVLKKIKPDEGEKKEVEEFSKKIISKAEEVGKTFNVKPMLCGSIAKGTWIANKNELDLFLLFNPTLPRSHLEKQGLEIGKQIVKEFNGKFEIAFAEHPYVSGKIKNNNRTFDVDIVPCYDLKDIIRIKTAVDRTPHHVKYIKDKLKLPDEVRLLKQFLVSNEIYGADVKTLGFSGYLCELLILAYGKFSNLVKEASKWRAPTVVNVERDYKKEELVKKFKFPLIIIDPVDSNRNVSAAVSVESFYRFIKACKEFTERPSYKFFFQENIPYSLNDILKEVKKRGTRWYVIKIKRPQIVEDTLYPQLRRAINAINKIIIEEGFRTLRKDVYCDEDSCYLIFEMEIWLVPKFAKNIGPNVYSKHAEDFLKYYKNSKIFIEGEYWIVEKERKFIALLHLLKDFVSKSEEHLLEKGIPSKIAPQMSKAELYAGGEVFKLMKSKEFGVFMHNWFEKDLNVV